jgi:hypothetical protein
MPSEAGSSNPKPGGLHIGRQHSPKAALKQKKSVGIFVGINIFVRLIVI